MPGIEVKPIKCMLKKLFSAWPRPFTRKEKVHRMETEEKLTFRVVTIGDSSVGKTSIINRFLRDTFEPDEPNTIGVLYDSFVQECNGTPIEIQLWDTARQEQYRALGPVYYRNAGAALVVFDVSNRSSFENISDWIRSFRNVSAESATVIIIGNKCDRCDRAVSPEDAKLWAKSNGAPYIETSAKTGQGVNFLFDHLVSTLAPSLMCEGVPVNKDLLELERVGKGKCC
jgi:small GTP-binding protein